MFSFLFNGDQTKSSHNTVLPNLAVESNNFKPSCYCLKLPLGIEIGYGVGFL